MIRKVEKMRENQKKNQKMAANQPNDSQSLKKMEANQPNDLQS